MKRILTAAIIGMVILAAPRIQGGLRVMPEVGDLWVLSIGINEYDDSGSGGNRLHKLQSAVQDAEAIADAFRRNALAPAFKRQVHVALLVDAAATRAAILATLGNLAGQVKPEDTFVLFLSGIGAEYDGDYAFMSVDADPEQPMSGLMGRELKVWTDRIAARNQLLILDSGDSSYAEEAFARQLSADDALLKGIYERNVTILGFDGPATETSDHGLLTAAMLEGLKGAADLVDDCGPAQSSLPLGACFVPGITAREIEAYAAARVLQLSGTRSRLQSYAQGADFLLAVGKTKPDAGQAERGAVLLSSNPTTEPASPARRDYALLVGVDQYDHFPQLANPVHDAETLETELREVYGFETDVLRNSTEAEIRNKLRELANRKFGPQDQVLVFIAGHGEYIELGAGGEGYLIARDSLPQREGGANQLSHANLVRSLQNLQANHLMVVLDSCFSGTFGALVAGGARSELYQPAERDEVIRRNLKLRAKLWLTSSGRQYVSDGVPGSHSPFARKFLEALRRDQGNGAMLTSAQLFAGMQDLTVMPRYGSFPDSEPGAQFLFVPPARQAP